MESGIMKWLPGIRASTNLGSLVSFSNQDCTLGHQGSYWDLFLFFNGETLNPKALHSLTPVEPGG